MAPSQSPQPFPTARAHLHLAGERCPYCEQPIPNEKAEQVRARAEKRERELSDTLGARLTQRFTLEKAQIEASAKTAVEQARNEGAAALASLRDEVAAKENAARQDGRKGAEAAMREKLAEQERASLATLAAVQEKLVEAERAKLEAVNAAETVKAHHEAELKRRVQEVREAGELAANQMLIQQTQANAGLVELLQQKLANAEQGKREASGQVEALKATHATDLNERIQEVREAMEVDKTKALNAANAKHFDDTQKLTGKLAELQRQLEKKTADERGEGAEIDLLDELKAEFREDRIEQLTKREGGADIKHFVMHNGKQCGLIVYDSEGSECLAQ